MSSTAQRLMAGLRRGGPEPPAKRVRRSDDHRADPETALARIVMGTPRTEVLQAALAITGGASPAFLAAALR
jgi:hypothetical protein